MRNKKFRKTSTDVVGAENKKPTQSAQVSPYQALPKAPEQGIEPFIVNNIIMRSVDRTPKDVGSWMEALRAAESIYYPNRSRLLDLYKTVELDGFLSGIIDKRIKSVVNKKLRFVKDSKEVEEVEKLIKSKYFRGLCKLALKSIFWGCTGAEFIPGEKFQYKEIPVKHIKPEKKVIAINQTDYDGIPYEDIDNIIVFGEDRDLGMLLKAAFYVLLKKGDFADWANYIEIFGMPLIVTRFDTFDEKTKAQLTQAMEEIGSAMRLSIPKQAEIEVMDGKTSNGNGDLQNKFKDACNNELSVLILGNTETTGNQNGGSNAKASEQGKQQDEIIKDDSLMLLGVLNDDKFLNILANYGYPVDGGEFIINEAADPAELLIQSQIDEALQRLGVPLDDDYFYSAYNRPKPADYDKMKAELHEKQETPDQEAQEDAGGADAVPDKKQSAKQQAAEKAKKAQLSAWQKLRASLADFFDPGHKG